MSTTEISTAHSPLGQPMQPKRRAWLRWVGLTVVLGLMLLIGSCVGCTVVGSRARAEGSQFAASSIDAVARPWRSEDLLNRAAPELLEVMPKEKLESFVGFVARRLGSVKKCGAVQNGQWRVFVGAKGPAVFTWHYADCEFDRGPGRLTLQLVRRRGDWKILTFNVNSDLLMRDEQQ